MHGQYGTVPVAIAADRKCLCSYIIFEDLCMYTYSMNTIFAACTCTYYMRDLHQTCIFLPIKGSQFSHLILIQVIPAYIEDFSIDSSI